LYPEKKIRNIVFRLIPNHGRQYPKEKSVRQVDLDALQNHHDLLCTLYRAAPPSCRPSLNALRDLVHAESSHREACHISIKAWKYLVRFQLSTDEPAGTLGAFGEWHGELMSQLLHQRRYARTEAQLQFNSVMTGNGSTISVKLLESTIDQNQRQAEALLGDALTSMVVALESARNGSVTELLRKGKRLLQLYVSGTQLTGNSFYRGDLRTLRCQQTTHQLACSLCSRSRSRLRSSNGRIPRSGWTSSSQRRQPRLR
jgi:hypothetical protein